MGLVAPLSELTVYLVLECPWDGVTPVPTAPLEKPEQGTLAVCLANQLLLRLSSCISDDRVFKFHLLPSEFLLLL